MVRDAARTRNPRVLRSLLSPAVRGFILRQGRSDVVDMPLRFNAHFDFQYKRDRADLGKLYTAAKRDQWDADKLAWNTHVDPDNAETPLIGEELFPLAGWGPYDSLSAREKRVQIHAMLSWLLSQFLHGEQGALFASAQVTEAVPWTDGMLYGATQVVDEARHVEVFHRYVTEKLEKLYQIDDNLFVVIDSLMRDSRWDMKFLGMQIMVEGLALGAFGAIRQSTTEPLLRELLRFVITDEARHVHYGVLALEGPYRELSEPERREREDWAFEVSLLLRNRFLAHELRDEFWGHAISRSEWNRRVLGSELMRRFRSKMFRRIVPNLNRIGLLTPRVRPFYEAAGLLEFASDKASPDISVTELLGDTPTPT
ncbi:MAG: ferritin-like domain-containing protein [Deltaproteobacteria bacterium]|nr:ferritin-like domain-containing protein [Deltaproteobacteria bacterium]